MVILKILLILIVTLAVLVIAVSDKYKTQKRLLLLGLYVSVVVMIVSPSLADVVARWVSIEYGTDLAVYLSIAVLVMSGAINYARGNKQGRITTTLIRELAIKDVKIT